LKHVLAIKANKNANGWLSHSELADVIDLYVVNLWHDGKPKGAAADISLKIEWDPNRSMGSGVLISKGL
jgi:hypothetical protein